MHWTMEMIRMVVVECWSRKAYGVGGGPMGTSGTCDGLSCQLARDHSHSDLRSASRQQG